VKPQRSETRVVVTELDGELLVYDLERHRAHCLNAPAAYVYRRCDGRTSVAAIAAGLRQAGLAPKADESLVWLALSKLEKAQLVGPAAEAPALSRRELVRRAAALSGLLLPAVTSIVSPTPAEAAATCVTDCTGRPFGTPCSISAPSNCLCSCDGVGNCVGGC
jgi:hypothetical protein